MKGDQPVSDDNFPEITAAHWVALWLAGTHFITARMGKTSVGSPLTD